MSNTKKTCLLLLGLLLFFGNNTSVRSSAVEEQEIIAVLTLNLVRFTHWPNQILEKKVSVFNLCVIGDNVVQQAFANIENKRVKDKTVHIINITRLRSLSQCQLLYVSNLERNKLRLVLIELKNKPVLTIGKNIEFLKAGGMVGLEKIDGKITININLPIIKQSDIVMSSRILKLSKIFNFPFRFK